MANSNNPFGIRLSRAVNPNELIPVFLPASYATATFINDPVVLTGTGNTSKIGIYDAGTLPEVNRSSATGAIFGLIQGFSQEEGVETKSNAASTARVAFVVPVKAGDLVEVQASGSIAATDFGNNAQITFATAGSSVTGLSGAQLDSANIANTATHPLKIVAVMRQQDNELGTNAKVLAMINNSQTSGGTGTAGV